MGIILKRVRASYVQIIEPKENLSGNEAYSCCVLIDKDDKANLALVDKAIQKAIAKGKATIWGGKKPSFRYQPLRDGDAELKSEERSGKEYENCCFFNPSILAAKGKPGVVDENLRPVIKADKVYSGCYVNIEVNPYPYKNSGNAGVGWGLQNVMFCEDGDRLDGRQSAENAFASLAPENADDIPDDDIPF